MRYGSGHTRGSSICIMTHNFYFFVSKSQTLNSLLDILSQNSVNTMQNNYNKRFMWMLLVILQCNVFTD